MCERWADILDQSCCDGQLVWTSEPMAGCWQQEHKHPTPAGEVTNLIEKNRVRNVVTLFEIAILISHKSATRVAGRDIPMTTRNRAADTKLWTAQSPHE